MTCAIIPSYIILHSSEKRYEEFQSATVATDAAHAEGAHEPGHPLAADVDAEGTEFGVHSRRATFALTPSPVLR